MFCVHHDNRALKFTKYFFCYFTTDCARGRIGGVSQRGLRESKIFEPQQGHEKQRQLVGDRSRGGVLSQHGHVYNRVDHVWIVRDIEKFSNAKLSQSS